MGTPTPCRVDGAAGVIMATRRDLEVGGNSPCCSHPPTPRLCAQRVEVYTRRNVPLRAAHVGGTTARGARDADGCDDPLGGPRRRHPSPWPSSCVFATTTTGEAAADLRGVAHLHRHDGSGTRGGYRMMPVLARATRAAAETRLHRPLCSSRHGRKFRQLYVLYFCSLPKSGSPCFTSTAPCHWLGLLCRHRGGIHGARSTLDLSR